METTDRHDRAHFLIPDLTGNTGGSKWDREIYEKVTRWQGSTPLSMCFDYFGEQYKRISKQILRWNLVYKKNAEDILNCDYLFINASLAGYLRAFPWSKKHDCKVIVIIHHPEYMNFTGRKEKYHRESLLKLLRHADRIVTPNKYVYDWLKARGFEEKSDNVGLDSRHELHRIVPPREKVLCFVGTVEPRKGLEYGIRAFAEFAKENPDYIYRIAGEFGSGNSDPEYCKSLTALVKELGVEDKVQFLGRITDAEKARLYAGSSVFLFPSQTEGYGMVLLEAMSYGLPIVAFDTSAIPYTVNPSNGYTVPNKNTNLMAFALSALASNPALYERLSSGAYRTAEQMPTKEQTERDWDEYLNSL